jgi:hypothetical protein
MKVIKMIEAIKVTSTKGTHSDQNYLATFQNKIYIYCI